MTKFYQLSYPHSGANWLRYISRYILDIDKEYTLSDDHSDQYIKTHTIPIQKHEPIETDRHLIVILRHFNECMLSHNKQISDPNQAANYFHPLEIYHDWKSPKLMIYYMNLVTRPRIIILQLSYFLTGSVVRGHAFLKEYDKHKSKSITNCKHVQPCRSQGQIYHHGRKIREHVNQFNLIAKNKCPEHLFPYIDIFFRDQTYYD